MRKDAKTASPGVTGGPSRMSGTWPPAAPTISTAHDGRGQGRRQPPRRGSSLTPVQFAPHPPGSCRGKGWSWRFPRADIFPGRRLPGEGLPCSCGMRMAALLQLDGCRTASLQHLESAPTFGETPPPGELCSRGPWYARLTSRLRRPSRHRRGSGSWGRASGCGQVIPGKSCKREEPQPGG